MNRFIPGTVRALALALAMIATSWTVTEFNKGVLASSATLRIDLSTSGGSGMVVFINDSYAEPLTAALVPGLRRTYELPGITEDVFMLRLDPTDVANAQVVIYSVELVAGHAILARFGPDELRSWWTSNLAPLPDADGFAFRSGTGDPILMKNVQVQLPRVRSRWRVAIHDAMFDAPLQPVIWLLPLMVLGTALAGRGIGHLAVLVIAVVAGPRLIREVMSWQWPAVPVSVAISRAAFVGESLYAGQAAMAILAGLFVLLGGTAGYVKRSSVGRDTPPISEAQGRQREFATGWLGLALAGIAVALLVAPDLSKELQSATLARYSPNWDEDNFLYWRYLAHHGALPFRDFWYAYGGFYLFDRPWASGPATQWAFDAALFSVLLWVLWRLLPEARTRAFAVVVLLALAYRLPLMFQVERYLLGPTLVISYLAARYEKASRWSLAPFLMTAALALFFEPAQLVFAGPAIVVLTAVDLWRRTAGTPVMHALRLPLRAAMGVLALTTLVAIVLAARGQLGGFFQFYARLQDMVQYSSLPTYIDPAWVPQDLQLAVLLWPVVLLGIGAYELMRADGPHGGRLGEASLALGLVAFMVMQKALVRPLEYTMLTPLITATLVYGALSFSARSLRFQLMESVAVGMILGVLILQGRWEASKDLLIETPTRFARSLNVLSDRESVARVNRERWAPQRFAGYRSINSLVQGVRARWHPDGPLSVFALSDSPVTYILTGQSPVWLSNLYNASPLYEQKRLAAWLTETPPNFVVFDANLMKFDDVPTVVRVPVVVNAVISGYVPVGTIETFDVLRRRRSDEPIPLAYWRQRLGNTLDLGHLPGLLDVKTRGACQPDRPCDEYVALTLRQTSEKRAALALDVGGSLFEIQFAVSPTRSLYVIPLSRLWIWQAAKMAAVPIELDRAQSKALSTMRLRRVARAEDRLY